MLAPLFVHGLLHIYEKAGGFYIDLWFRLLPPVRFVCVYYIDIGFWFYLLIGLNFSLFLCLMSLVFSMSPYVYASGFRVAKDCNASRGLSS